jgi:hypothetical protein
MLAVHEGVSNLLQITAEALWLPQQRTSDRRFAFGLAAFGAGTCVRFLERARVDLAGCGSVWVGALHAVVYEPAPTQPGDHPWAAAAVTPRLRAAVGAHLLVEVGAHLFVPLVRQPFTVTGDVAPAFQEPPVAFLPFVSLGAQMP